MNNGLFGNWLVVDKENKQMKGLAKAGYIKRLGLIEASARVEE